MSYNNCLQQQNFCCPPVFALPPFPSSSPLLTSAASMLWWKGTGTEIITVDAPIGDAFGYAYVGDGGPIATSLTPLAGTPESRTGLEQVLMVATGIEIPVNGRIRTFGIRYDLFLIATSQIPAGSFIEYTVYRAPTTVNSGLAADAAATPAVEATLVTGQLFLPTLAVLGVGGTANFTLSRTYLLGDAVFAGDRLILIVRFVPGPGTVTPALDLILAPGAISVTGSVFYKPNGVVV